MFFLEKIEKAPFLGKTGLESMEKWGNATLTAKL